MFPKIVLICFPVLTSQIFNELSSCPLTKYFPSVPGNKLTQKLPYLFDEVLYLGVKTDPSTNQSFRFIQTQPDFQVAAKDRSGKLNFTEPPNLGLIINKIIGVQQNG